MQEQGRTIREIEQHSERVERGMQGAGLLRTEHKKQKQKLFLLGSGQRFLRHSIELHPQLD